MSQAAALNRFLAEVEASAFRLARAAVRDQEDALDIVQETMFTLARKYARKPPEQWRPLFFRILQNRIRDHYRRATVRRRIIGEAVSDGSDHIDQADGGPGDDPAVRTSLDDAVSRLEEVVAALPLRQQQAFLLRALEGMDVRETARAMRCSEGSVKTHYFRAMRALREALEEHRT
jgi:RNA polymerase sigma-70 factor (ECF subfamily)